MTIDNQPRYAPEIVMTVKGKRPVVQAIAYPPNAHPEKCPLISDCVALELVTDIGVSRWYGCQHAEINSELRMVVTGFNAGFEEMAAWPKATKD